MKPSLAPGLTFTFRYRVPEEKTVPFVFREAEKFQDMPRVFATAFMVGLMEWSCVEAIQAHLDAGEQSVGTAISVTHTAATPPGLTVTVSLTLEKVEGRKLAFRVQAHDGLDPIGEGTHERVVIDRARFLAKLGEKVARARG